MFWTALLLAIAQPAAAAPEPPRLVEPAAWQLDPQLAAQHYRLERLHGVAHLVPGDGAPPGAVGAALQDLDPIAWRGRLVRFRARVRLVRPGGSAVLEMVVGRPSPKRAGFNSFMAEQPISSTGWRSYEIVGRIAPDAVRLRVAIVARDRAELLVDHVSLAPVQPNPAPPSPSAVAYLDEVIGLLRDQHIDSAHADWPRIVANAHAEIGGARTPRDTYWAILGVIGELGEPHTAIHPPGAAIGSGGLGPPPAMPLPDGRLVDGRFGLVHVPMHAGSEAQGVLYRDTLRRQLQELDRAGICGWIVDLRGNTGGNMWPMMRGLDPLLGEPPFGRFVDAHGGLQYWGRIQNMVLPMQAVGRDPPAFSLAGADLPVAVLLDGQTMSSGEMVAIAFAGRAASRSFGAPTGGYTTGNRVLTLSDGGSLVLTGTHVGDRTGRLYDGPLTPDEPVDPAQAEAAAARWLSAQPSCAH
jgi:hypothetical protein